MKKVVLCLLLLVIFLVSCGESGAMEDKSVLWADIYYRSDSETIGSEPFAVELENNLRKMMTEAINQMSKDPVAKELSPSLPEGIQVESISIKYGDVALELSDEFLTLSNVDKTIASTCIIKTLSNFTNIKTLDITVGGITQISQFSEALAVLDSPSIYTGIREIDVYLYNRAGELTKTNIKLELDGEILPEEIAMDTLLKGNLSYQSPIPEGCTVNSVEVSENVCYIDFSAELLTCPEEKVGEMIKAIVLTETSIEYIDAVKITVNGQSVRGFEKMNLALEFKNENFVKDE